jgi:hypothetical protein
LAGNDDGAVEITFDATAKEAGLGIALIIAGVLTVELGAKTVH